MAVPPSGSPPGAGPRARRHGRHRPGGALRRSCPVPRDGRRGGVPADEAQGPAADAPASPPAAETADPKAADPAADRYPGNADESDPQNEAEPPAVDPNCTLVVPREPLSATGLATPYQLEATDPAAGPCHEAVADQAAFVEAAVFDPATHAVSIYHPLVVDRRDRPAGVGGRGDPCCLRR
jgi:hypothetical protein